MRLRTSSVRTMTVLVFGNDMADAVAKQAASEAALRGAAAEQVSWLDALAWQVQRRIIEANLQASKTTPTVLISRDKGLRRAQYKTVLQSLFEQSTDQLAFRRSRQRCECQVCKQSMGETSLVRWLRAGPCAGEIQTMQEYWEFSWAGSAPGSCGGKHSNCMKKSYILRTQWPNIEVLRGAGIVRHGLLDLCAN